MPTMAMGSSRRRAGRRAAGRLRPVRCAGQFGRAGGGERVRGRVVEDQGGGQPQAGGGVEPVAQLDGGQRVEAEVLKARSASTGRPTAWPSTAATWPRTRSRSASRAARLGQAGEPRGRAPRRRRAGPPAGDRAGAAGRGPGRAAAAAARRPRPARSAAGRADRHQQRRRRRPRAASRSARPSSAVSGGDAGAGHPARSASPSAGHAAVGPQAPGERGARAGPGPRRCWASASRKALAAA